MTTRLHYLTAIKAAYRSRFRHFCRALIALYRTDYPRVITPSPSRHSP